MADKDTAEMTNPELIQEITARAHVRTRKSLVEFSREDLLRLLTCTKGYQDNHETDRWYT